MLEIVDLIQKFDNELLLLLFGVLTFVAAVFVWVWLANKKRFANLKHQIPASVVRDYLDTMISNSSSLKSALLRSADGGVPSVMPIQTMGGGDSVGAVDAAELAKKNAEISALLAQISEKTSLISELEKEIEKLKAAGGGGGEVDTSEFTNKISELEKQLEEAKASGGGGDEALVKERDELKSRLQEYEIIEDDLANLKRLQQENEQLKKALADGGGAPPAAAEPAAAPAAAPAAEPAAEAAPPGEADVEGIEAPPTPEGEEKSPEDLLSEFEKMLG